MTLLYTFVILILYLFEIIRTRSQAFQNGNCKRQCNPNRVLELHSVRGLRETVRRGRGGGRSFRDFSIISVAEFYLIREDYQWKYPISFPNVLQSTAVLEKNTKTRKKYKYTYYISDLSGSCILLDHSYWFFASMTMIVTPVLVA